jgi:hypothetical protein
VDFESKLISDILELEEELWIPMHRIKYADLADKDLDYLTMYYNKLVHVRDNPV